MLKITISFCDAVYKIIFFACVSFDYVLKHSCNPNPITHEVAMPESTSQISTTLPLNANILPQQSHRTDGTPFPLVQVENRKWWTTNTMSYDWNDRVTDNRFSVAWFDEIDRRFVQAARLFATDKLPFDKILPLDQLAGRDVLEIGCGMGLHTELMVRAGARVQAIDLSDTSIEATRQRLQLKGLNAAVNQGDAEALPFADRQFDFVWSWGVIHHSSHTAKIVREISRVLRPDGECRIMVYNREGMAARVAFLKDHLLKGKIFRNSFDQTLHQSTDGFSARHYVRDQFEDLFRAFFRHVSIEVCGLESDAIPLPRYLRRVALRIVSSTRLKSLQARYGSFLLLTARCPS